MTAPDRIRVAQDADGFWTCREAVSGSQEYVRADLYAALEAELAERADDAEAQANYEQRIRSALVDVPAGEPVAYLRLDNRTDIDGETYTGLQMSDVSDERAFPVYTSPPLSREGEDNAEVIEEGAKVLAKWIGYAWDGLSDRDISAEYKDWAYNGIGALGMQGGKPALRKVAASILALAATRSDSATNTSGSPSNALDKEKGNEQKSG